MSTAYKKIEEILKKGMSSYFRLFYRLINRFSTLVYNLSTSFVPRFSMRKYEEAAPILTQPHGVTFAIFLTLD